MVWNVHILLKGFAVVVLGWMGGLVLALLFVVCGVEGGGGKRTKGVWLLQDSFRACFGGIRRGLLFRCLVWCGVVLGGASADGLLPLQCMWDITGLRRNKRHASWGAKQLR